MNINSNRELPRSGPEHCDEYFIELAALSGTGTLSPAEWKHLEAHLSHCADCRAIKAEYDRVVSTTLPAMAANRVEAATGDSTEPWSLEKAEAALFESIERENIESDKPAPSSGSRSSKNVRWFGLLAAGLILPCSYVGYRIGVILSQVPSAPPPPTRESALIAHAESHEVVRLQQAATDMHDPQTTKRIAELQHDLRADATAIASLKEQHEALLEQLSQRDTALGEKEQQRLDLAHQLSVSQTNAQAVQAKLDQAVSELASSRQATQVPQQNVDALTAELETQKQLIAKQDELLAHDRDIRDLIGARELYIGEIYDVVKSGETRKPYGRVFYTRGKSLVFYAYDLDQQPGVKLASTFQVWGRKGIDQQHDVSLGIFYEDDHNKKRWILKSNDGATISQLDAVFVTIEPHGASKKPTGKPFLFTYLKLDPNHP